MECIATGAKGIQSFQSNVKYGSLPSETSLQHEGIIYDYEWETANEKEKLFRANYVGAVSKDPFNGNLEYYIGVGLSGCLDGDGLKKIGRPSLSLVVALDISGSMGGRFDSRDSDEKLTVAKNSLLALMNHFNDDDQFGLMTFNSDTFVLQELTPWKDINKKELKENILKLVANGGTNMQKALDAASSVFDKPTKKSFFSSLFGEKPKKRSSRLIFLTDADDGQMNSKAMEQTAQSNAKKGIFTTWIGIGIDFNTDLISTLSKVRGTNYFAVKSAKDFKRQMDDEFDYMVTVTTFNISVEFTSDGYQVERVYGSPGFEYPKEGRLLFIDSSFPSPKGSNPNLTKGGYIVVKLKKLKSDSSPIVFKTTYEDADGKKFGDNDTFTFPSKDEEFYGNKSIRKGILLMRFINFLKTFLKDARNQNKTPSISLETGIQIPPLDDPRASHFTISVSRQMDPKYKEMFGKFVSYFENEMEEIDDKVLEKELQSLNTILDNDAELKPFDSKPEENNDMSNHTGFDVMYEM